MRELDLYTTGLPALCDDLAEYGIAVRVTSANGEQWINIEPECWPEASIIAEAYFARFR